MYFAVHVPCDAPFFQNRQNCVYHHVLNLASTWTLPLIVLALFPGSMLSAQQSTTPPDIVAWVQQAAIHQTDELHHSTWALRYRVHRVDSKEDTIRDLIESTDGNVARTIARNGHALTPEQNAAEEQRLRAMSADELKRHMRGSETPEKYATELIRAMPSAMTYSLAPAQTQLPQFSVLQVVLDYKPNPQFHPANISESLLGGVAGRIWLDAETHHVLRMEIHITKNLNLALGLIARVYEGGTVVYEQQPVDGGHSVYSHIEINITLRELMVKTVPYHSKLDAFDVSVLPVQPTLKDAVTMLLSRPAAEDGHRE